MYLYSSGTYCLSSSSAHLPFGQGPAYDFRCCALLGDTYGLHGPSCVHLFVPNEFRVLISTADYIVQGHRFDIVEDLGCRPTIYVSIPAIFLIWVPPMAAAIATFGFAGMPCIIALEECSDITPQPLHCGTSSVVAWHSRNTFKILTLV